MLTVKPHLLYEASRTKRRGRTVSGPLGQRREEERGDQDVVVVPDLGGGGGGTAGRRGTWPEPLRGQNIPRLADLKIPGQFEDRAGDLFLYHSPDSCEKLV